MNKLYSIKLIHKATNGMKITAIYKIRSDSIHNKDISSVIYSKEKKLIGCRHYWFYTFEDNKKH
jgi:hypothetical protein